MPRRLPGEAAAEILARAAERPPALVFLTAALIFQFTAVTNAHIGR